MDNIDEVAPPYWGHTKADKSKGVKVGGTAEAMKKAQARGDIPKDMNIFALMWSMKNKGDKPHYKPGKKGVLKKKYKGPEGQNEGIIMNNQMDEGLRSALKKVGAKVKHKWKMATDDVYKDVDAAGLRPGQRNNPRPKKVSEMRTPRMGGEENQRREEKFSRMQSQPPKPNRSKGTPAPAPTLVAHTEYKRMGYAINELLGALGLAALGGAAGFAGQKLAKKVFGKSARARAEEKRKAQLAAKEKIQPGVRVAQPGDEFEESVGSRIKKGIGMASPLGWAAKQAEKNPGGLTSKLYKGTKEVARVAGMVPVVGAAGDAVAGGMTALQMTQAKDAARRKELGKELAGDALAAIPGAGLGTRGTQYGVKAARLAGKTVTGRAGAAVRMHGTKAAKAGGAAVDLAAKRKAEELRQQEGKQMRTKYMQALKEAHEAYVDPEAKKELKQGKADAGYAGPIARDIASRTKGNLIKNIRDPLVRREAGEAKERTQRKLSKMAKRGGKKMPRIRMSAKSAVQSALLKRRKTATKGLGKERPEDAKADAARDKWRKMAPGDK